MSRFASVTLGIRQRFAATSRPVKWVLALAAALFFYALPILNLPLLTTPDTDFGGVLFTVSVYVLVALGLNIVVGYAGLLDLGYVGFYAVGAYTVAMLTTEHGNWPYLLAIPAAVLVAMASGLILGFPTLRVRGDYLAIVTLGFGEIIRLTIVNSSWLGGAAGVSSIKRPPDLPLFDIPQLSWDTGAPLLDLDETVTFLRFTGPGSAISWYWFALTVIIVVIFADKLIKDSRVGRAWEATREDEDAAELMGVPTFRFKLLAFATGAAIGGLSGALFATKQQFINPDNFTILYSVLFVAMVVVGGQGNRWGVVLAAALLTWAPEKFRFLSDARFLLFGIALMALAIFRPQGLLPPRRSVRAKQADIETEVLEEGATHA